MIHQIIDSINFYFYKLRVLIEDLLSYSYFTEDQYKLISKLKTFNKKFQKKFLNECEELFNRLSSNNIKESKIYTTKLIKKFLGIYLISSFLMIIYLF